MILQIRTETFYAIEMTEQQIQELSIFFEGLHESDISAAIRCGTGGVSRQHKSIHETVQTFRLAIAEHNNIGK